MLTKTIGLASDTSDFKFLLNLLVSDLDSASGTKLVFPTLWHISGRSLLRYSELLTCPMFILSNDVVIIEDCVAMCNKVLWSVYITMEYLDASI